MSVENQQKATAANADVMSELTGVAISAWRYDSGATVAMLVKLCVCS